MIEEHKELLEASLELLNMLHGKIQWAMENQQPIPKFPGILRFTEAINLNEALAKVQP